MTVPAALARVLADVPVDPDADTAREWARVELADPVYREGESLLERLLTWVRDLFEGFGEGLARLDGSLAAVVLVAVLVVGVLVALVVAGPVRRARRARGRASTEVFVDDARTAAEILASAEAAAAAGRWNDAVLERFRAVLRSLEERAVLAERPGWTADEAAAEAGAVLPGCAADLRRASRLFDDVRYGDRRALPEDDAWLRDVAAAVRAARPVTPVVSTEPVLVVPR